jgi:dihydrofolate reductase
LYGRVTYQMMENYWPTAGDKPGASRHDIEHSKWYNKVHKVVLSKTLDPDSYRDAGPVAIGANTKIISDKLSDKINEIKQSPNGGSKDILLFGSPTATHSLIQLNLIDGYWLFVNPIILGRGVPLFTGINPDSYRDKIKLKLLTTRQFTCGVTELNYIVDRQ